MALIPVCRVGDTAQGICTAHTSPVGWTGVVANGIANTSCDGQALAGIGNTGPTSCGHTFRITAGSNVFSANGIKVARVGDAVIVIQGGTGTMTSGSPVCSSE